MKRELELVNEIEAIAQAQRILDVLKRRQRWLFVLGCVSIAASIVAILTVIL